MWRNSGVRRAWRAQSPTLSATLAVVAAAYCGYSGPAPARASRRRGAQFVQHRSHAGVAVAHRMAHQQFMAVGGQLHRPARRSERAVHTASGEPWGVHTVGVLRGRTRRPRAQDDAVQDGPPDEARYLHHARVAQELGEIAAQRRRGGRVGRAQVDQQHGAARRLAVVGVRRRRGSSPSHQRNHRGSPRENVGAHGAAAAAPSPRWASSASTVVRSTGLAQQPSKPARRAGSATSVRIVGGAQESGAGAAWPGAGATRAAVHSR